jgi:hypothetical protein
MNEYLKEFHESDVDSWGLRSYQARKCCIEKYGFAIPTPRVIEKIASYGRIIEVGAGTGYWAKLISEAGGDIIALDKAPVETGENRYKFRQSWFPVQKGGPHDLRCHADRVLFLCWPSYSTPFGAECLREYQGDTFLYVGEGPGGCCGDEDFWELLDKEWEGSCDSYISIPQWESIHDFFTAYRRKR